MNFHKNLLRHKNNPSTSFITKYTSYLSNVLSKNVKKVQEKRNQATFLGKLYLQKSLDFGFRSRLNIYQTPALLGRNSFRILFEIHKFSSESLPNHSPMSSKLS